MESIMMTDVRLPKNLLKDLRDGLKKILCFKHPIDNDDDNNIYNDMRYTYQRLVALKVKHYLKICWREALTDFLVNEVRVNVLNNLSNCHLIDTLSTVWSNFKMSLALISNIIIRSKTNNNSPADYDFVTALGMHYFHELVIRYDNICTHLTIDLMNLVTHARLGEEIDYISFRNICEMLISIGDSESRDVYNNIFEQQFLERSSDFYFKENNRLLKQNNAWAFVKVAKQRLKNEERQQLYYDETTKTKLFEIINTQLIANNMQLIFDMENSGVMFMLRNDKIEQLHSLLKLYSRVSDSMPALILHFNMYLSEVGTSIKTEDKCKSNPMLYIQSFLDLYDKFHNFFEDTNASKEYKLMFNHVFKHMLCSYPRSSVNLSFYIIDMLIKKETGLLVNDVDFDKPVTILNYLLPNTIEEYKLHFALRLLNKIVSRENELYFLSQIKTKVCNKIILKMEYMVYDLFYSQSLMEEFKEYIDKPNNRSHTVDLNVDVLTTKYWPTFISSKCNIPLATMSVFEQFQQFYLAKYQGRKLILQPQLGTVDLNAVFDQWPDSDENNTHQKLTKRNYLLQVSTYQMCVLSLFNIFDKLTFKDILDKTKIPKNDLVWALQSLFLMKSSQRVLLKTPQSKNIEFDHEFCVNELFTSQSHRVKVHANLCKLVTKSGRKDCNEAQKFKKYESEIKKEIMNLMKINKEMTHCELMKRTKHLFKNKHCKRSDLIKILTTRLTYKGYLTKSTNSVKTYVYVQPKIDGCK